MKRRGKSSSSRTPSGELQEVAGVLGGDFIARVDCCEAVWLMVLRSS